MRHASHAADDDENIHITPRAVFIATKSKIEILAQAKDLRKQTTRPHYRGCRHNVVTCSIAIHPISTETGVSTARFVLRRIGM